MEFSDYIAKQNQLIGKVEAYIEVKEITSSKSLIFLLDQMIRNTFAEKELLKLEYDNAELEGILLEHNEK